MKDAAHQLFEVQATLAQLGQQLHNLSQLVKLETHRVEADYHKGTDFEKLADVLGILAYAKNSELGAHNLAECVKIVQRKIDAYYEIRIDA